MLAVRLALRVVILACLLAAAPILAADRPRDISESLRTLAAHGVEPNTNGLKLFLQRLIPTPQQKLASARLVEELGSAEFANRAQATKQLMALAIPPHSLLLEATESRDLEVRLRARKILATDRSHHWRPVTAALQVIEANQVRGLVKELLDLAAATDEQSIAAPLRAAVRATVTAEDVPLLETVARSQNTHGVIAAIQGLGAVSTDGTVARLHDLLQHRSERVQLTAARALANRGDRRSIAPLVQLLDGSTLEVRRRAAQTLRQLSGLQMGYSAHLTGLARHQSTKQWRTWAQEKSATARLHFPLPREIPLLGRTLIAIASQNRVLDLPAAGGPEWSTNVFGNPWGCVGLPNGNRLVSSRTGRSLVEFDSAGKVVWSKMGLPAAPINVQRLDNGNTLVACFEAQSVIEIRPDKTTAWELGIPGGPVDVQRLNNRRTLITLHQPDGRVIEVDRKGKVHWELGNLNMPMTAQRLPNGNTLVAEYASSRVAEWSIERNIVWQPASLSELKNPYSAQRLQNGNSLITHSGGVVEIDMRGKIVWQKELNNVRHAMRY